MGTNYFIRWNKCDTCGRFEEQHIGKFSLGWRFLAESSLKCKFTTWKQFEGFLRKNAQNIYTDSNDTPVDVENLILEIKECWNLRNHLSGPGHRDVIPTELIDIAEYEFR